MSRRNPSTLEQYKTDEATFKKLGKKYDGYKNLIKAPQPTHRNIKAAAKFALRLMDHWTRWEQSARKLVDETNKPDPWRQVENFK